ncbi:MAG: hypothetical protein ACP5OF_07155 [bacterium]
MNIVSEKGLKKLNRQYRRQQRIELLKQRYRRWKINNQFLFYCLQLLVATIFWTIFLLILTY